MQEPIIRPMVEADLPAVVALEQSVEYGPWTVVSFRDCMSSPHHAFVYDLNQQAIGFGIISLGISIGEAQILKIAIEPHYQRQGLGRKMLIFLIDFAKEHKIKHIFLEVRESNQQAFELYSQMGFNEIGQRQHYYPMKHGRENAIIMGLEL